MMREERWSMQPGLNKKLPILYLYPGRPIPTNNNPQRNDVLRSRIATELQRRAQNPGEDTGMVSGG